MMGIYTSLTNSIRWREFAGATLKYGPSTGAETPSTFDPLQPVNSLFFLKEGLSGRKISVGLN